MEQSSNQARGVPKVSQSLANPHKKTEIVRGVQAPQMKRAAHAKPRDERALPSVPKTTIANVSRQI